MLLKFSDPAAVTRPLRFLAATVALVIFAPSAGAATVST